MGNISRSSFATFINIGGLNTYLLGLVRFLVKKYGFFFTVTKNSFIKKSFEKLFSKKLYFSNQNNAVILSNSSYRVLSFIKNLNQVFKSKGLDKPPVKTLFLDKSKGEVKRLVLNKQILDFKGTFCNFTDILYFTLRKFLRLLTKKVEGPSVSLQGKTDLN